MKITIGTCCIEGGEENMGDMTIEGLLHDRELFKKALEIALRGKSEDTNRLLAVLLQMDVNDIVFFTAAQFGVICALQKHVNKDITGAIGKFVPEKGDDRRYV